MTCLFQSSLGYHTWGNTCRFSATLCGFSAVPADFVQYLQIFCNTLNILWLKRQPNSFEEYLCVRELHFDLWRDWVYKLWRL